MIGEAFAYPRRGEDWLMRTIIGGVLVLVGAFILIPLLLVEGYLYRVLGRTTRYDRQPPAWEDWIDLFVEGVQMYIVQIAYLLVPAILLVIGAFLTVLGPVADGGTTTVGFGILIVGGILQVLAAYLLPAALTNFAYHERLGAAFDVRTVFRIAFTFEYFVVIVLVFIIGIIVGTIGAILSLIMVGVFILFYLHVAIGYLFAQAYLRGGGETNLA